MLLGQGVSALGDAVSFTAVPLLVLRVTGSGAAVGLIGMLQFIPDLAFGLIAGAYVDRWDRRLVMLGADIGRGVLTALIPLSFLLGWPTMVVLLLVVVPINTFRGQPRSVSYPSRPPRSGSRQLIALLGSTD